MKKSKLLSLTLTLALVFTTVFAGTESIFAAERNAAPMTKAAVMQALEDTTADDENTITAVNINKEKAESYSIAYGYNNMTYTKVKMPAAGTIMVDILSNAYTQAAIYSVDENGKADKMLKTIEIPAASTTDDYRTLSARVESAGIYYVVFATNASEAMSYLWASYAPVGKTVTPTKGKAYYASNKAGTTRYYKVKTTGTGYLTISFPGGSAGDSSKYNIKVMNYKKSKTLSKETVNYNKDYVTYAGLTKGTYYVAVTSSTDDWYSIKLKATTVKENSGSSKSKAKSILKGGTKKGIITATQSKSSGDWYKIKVNSTQKVWIAVDTKSGGATGGIKVSFYDSKKSFGSGEYYYGEPSGELNPYTTINGYAGNKVLYPGTYYIKVTKYGSGNGWYSLKWK